MEKREKNNIVCIINAIYFPEETSQLCMSRLYELERAISSVLVLNCSKSWTQAFLLTQKKLCVRSKSSTY